MELADAQLLDSQAPATRPPTRRGRAAARPETADVRAARDHLGCADIRCVRSRSAVRLIRLGQLLKLADLIDSGAEVKQPARRASPPRCASTAKPESRRGRQLHPGDVIEVDGQEPLRITGHPGMTVLHRPLDGDRAGRRPSWRLEPCAAELDGSVRAGDRRRRRRGRARRAPQRMTDAWWLIHDPRIGPARRLRAVDRAELQRPDDARPGPRARRGARGARGAGSGSTSNSRRTATSPR